MASMGRWRLCCRSTLPFVVRGVDPRLIRTFMFHTLKLCAALWPCLLLRCTASLPPSRSLTHHPPQPQVLFAHAQADEADLRVMSFNLRTPFILDGPTHWTFRDEMVVDTIRRFQPDLLGTQEC